MLKLLVLNTTISILSLIYLLIGIIFACNRKLTLIKMPNSVILTDDELMTAIQFRYRLGAEYLYDNYSPVLFKVISCIVKDKQLAEELLEEVLLKICTSFDSYFEQNNRLIIWMCGLARSAAKEKLCSIKELKASHQTEPEIISFSFDEGLNAQFAL